jgi:sporulation protein YlmC with PRC-barrel domain
VTDEEQKKANLGGPELFLAGIGRLDEDRFVKHFCNKCEKEYEGAPSIVYENPNEELGEGVTLAEKGEYKCKTCSATIAQYRKFETSEQPPAAAEPSVIAPRIPAAQMQSPPSGASAGSVDNYLSIHSLVGMSAYDSEAMLIGSIEEVGLRRSGGDARITLRIAGKEVPWDSVSKIGDIVLVQQGVKTKTASGGRCPSCGFQNEADSAFCAECGSKF